MRSTRRPKHRNARAKVYGQTVVVPLRPVGCARMEVMVGGRWYRVSGS